MKGSLMSRQMIYLLQKANQKVDRLKWCAFNKLRIYSARSELLDGDGLMRK